MKYIHATITALLAVFLLTVFTSCSPDIEEEERIMEVSEEAVVQEPEEPHWADGTVTIETGRHRTGMDLYHILESKRNFNGNIIVRATLTKRDFPMSQVKKTVEVSVVTLEEVLGETEAEKPLTLREVRRAYKKLGYRPLTLEEVVELRIQFEDQPTGKESRNGRMTRFLTLLTDKAAIYAGNSDWEYLFYLYRDERWGDTYGQGYGLGSFLVDKGEDPYKFTTGGPIHLRAFACVKE